MPYVCAHCGDHVNFEDDPSPDLCVMCYKAGRTTPMWDAARQVAAGLIRLATLSRDGAPEGKAREEGTTEDK